jgi:methionine-rich copper-binding protein CopC
MRRIVVVGCLAFVLASVPAVAALAQAAPQMTASDPEDGAQLHEAPDTVSATFNEPLDESSKMVVEDHCGNRLDDGNVTVSVNELSVGIAKKPAGHYIVTFAATGVGGVTGNTNGTFSFEVHAGTECTGGSGHHHHGGTGSEHTGHNGHTGSQHEGHEGHGASHEHAGGHTEHSGHLAGEHADHAEHAEHADHTDAEHHHEDASAVAAEQLKEQKEARVTQIASGDSPYPGLGPNSEAVLMSLGLAAAFGLLGGWVLRVSS